MNSKTTNVSLCTIWRLSWKRKGTSLSWRQSPFSICVPFPFLPDSETVEFLYKLAAGVCPKSYGMNVARMAVCGTYHFFSLKMHANQLIKGSTKTDRRESRSESSWFRRGFCCQTGTRKLQGERKAKRWRKGTRKGERKRKRRRKRKGCTGRERTPKKRRGEASSEDMGVDWRGRTEQVCPCQLCCAGWVMDQF